MNNIRNRNGITEIFDPVRKKWIKLTEEEQVRQNFVLFLIHEKKIPLSHISVEKQIKVNGLTKRYDIVVYDNQGKPEMVIECKSPKVPLTQEVIDQASRYNSTLNAPILGVVNGIESRFYKINQQQQL
ncbi:MAG: type I restriction enzyme HsdR N-terminal domain-containing protein [Bacteroidales bacterium]|jgi:hypothetical protein|nr:type I restriction enzyme HsdR N-terminal domain-containing protein [Bacteroidales bacterium]